MPRLIAFALINLGAYLVLRQLWPSFRVGRRRLTFWGLAALALLSWLVPLVLGLGLHGVVPVVGVPLKIFGSVWLIAGLLVLLLGSLVLLLDLPFALFGRAPQGAIDMGRRGFLKGIGRGVPLAAVTVGTGGVLNGSSGFTVREEEVRLSGLPRALDGFRIGQITDIHVGAFIDPAYVRRAVMAMNEAQVHLQVMTGDLVDDLQQLDETMAALEECRAPHGMLAILGNHEYWRGLGPIREAYAASARRGGPIRLLVDEAHVIEHAGQKVRVVGVNYPMTEGLRGGKAEKMRRSADVAFRDASPDEVLLCLSHHPDFFPLAAEKGARLTLSGHTHGGQVAFFGVLAFGFAFKHMLGRYRRGDNHLYVSGGTGHWLPFRVGVPAEVTLLTLRAV